MLHEDSVGHELKTLMNKINRKAAASIPPEIKLNVTEMQSQVIGYLHFSELRGQNVYQRDVEARFSITRATASKMLTLMEQNGLVTRSSVAGDARLKKLMLTEKAQEFFQKLHRGMAHFDEELTRGMTKEEKATLLLLLRKIEQNVGT